MKSKLQEHLTTEKNKIKPTTVSRRLRTDCQSQRLQPSFESDEQRHRIASKWKILEQLLLFFDPGTQFPGNENSKLLLQYIIIYHW